MNQSSHPMFCTTRDGRAGRLLTVRVHDGDRFTPYVVGPDLGKPVSLGGVSFVGYPFSSLMGRSTWWKGCLGEILAGVAFFQPEPPRRILEHQTLGCARCAPARNVPPEDWHRHCDVVSYDEREMVVEGVMEVKTSARRGNVFPVSGSGGLNPVSWFHTVDVAERQGIPTWFGVVRLKRDFPEDARLVHPGVVARYADLTDFISEIAVYPRTAWQLTESRIRLKPDSEPRFRSEFPPGTSAYPQFAKELDVFLGAAPR